MDNSQVVQRVKTVDMGCVFDDRGMRAACVADGGLPFARSTAIFKAALSQQVGDGGCPDIPPPPKRAGGSSMADGGAGPCKIRPRLGAVRGRERPARNRSRNRRHAHAQAQALATVVQALGQR